MSAGQWAFWLSIAALVAAFGKFLDEYHIKVATKAKMRNALVGWFVWLDAHKVPDLGGIILRAIRNLFQTRRIALVAVSLAVAYWATLSAFYLGREVFGPPNDQSYGNYLLTWIPLDGSALYWVAFLAAVIIPALLGLLAMAHHFHRASLAENDGSRLGFLALGLLFGVSLSLSGAALALLAFRGGGYFIGIIVFAGMASAALPILLLVLTLLLILIRYGIRLVRILLLHVFDVASGPSVSPFTYASSLIGVLILSVKVVQAALTF
ncbi:hypothetical protein [Rhizobium leguminosarum]|uniref:hypothetical protein n=1 Tax=Rhizobium leguminosarum TaxID=384 RepID=UPI0004A47694|nr:hypothetical protein [Rhizobium leguminosarum]